MVSIWQCGAPRRLVFSGLLTALCGCVTPLVEAQSAGAQAQAPVQAIVLERTCFGCPGAMRLVLRNDGTALLTQIGNARRGTEDKTSRGTLPKAEFDKLAQLALAQGFYAMQDRYQNGNDQDGEWIVITLTRGTTDKQVMRREDAGPLALKAIEAAIDAVKDRTTFTPDRP